MRPASTTDVAARLRLGITRAARRLRQEGGGSLSPSQSAALVTVDPSPWWNRKYKKVSYAWGESTSGVAAHFAFNFTVPHASVNEDHADHVAPRLEP